MSQSSIPINTNSNEWEWPMDDFLPWRTSEYKIEWNRFPIFTRDKDLDPEKAPPRIVSTNKKDKNKEPVGR